MSAHEMKNMGSVEVGRVPEPGSVPYGVKGSQTGLRRVFSWTQMFFFALSYMSSWEAMAANIGLVFWNGGPRAMVWGFFIVVPGVLCQVASIAEMASMLPIAGVQYHFTWWLAPPKHRRFLTWLQGWITWFSWVSLLAGITNITANVTLTLAGMSFPEYAAQQKSWHTVLVMYAYLVVLALLTMFGFPLIPWIELFAGLLHTTLWVVFAAVLLTFAPRHSDSFVWLEKANNSGWNSDFVSFNLGIILITWGFVGFDASAHISEETRKARLAIPQTMFWGIVANSFMAFGMVLIFLYCLGGVDEAMHAVYPLALICQSATQSVTGASAMIGMIVINGLAGTLGSVASVSRLTWAWARDGALPSYFAYIDPKFRIPLRSVWLPILLVMLLSLLNLANYTAFSVIISLSTFGLYQSYFIAIACMLHARLRGTVIDAPWSLGRFGVAINAFALVYTAWLGVFMLFPSYLPITATGFNYALPITAFIWLFAIVLWFAWGKKNWPGLNAGIIEKVVADGDRDTKEL